MYGKTPLTGTCNQKGCSLAAGYSASFPFASGSRSLEDAGVDLAWVLKEPGPVDPSGVYHKRPSRKKVPYLPGCPCVDTHPHLGCC